MSEAHRIEFLEEELDAARQDLVDRAVELRIAGLGLEASFFLEAAEIVAKRVRIALDG